MRLLLALLLLTALAGSAWLLWGGSDAAPAGGRETPRTGPEAGTQPSGPSVPRRREEAADGERVTVHRAGSLLPPPADPDPWLESRLRLPAAADGAAVLEAVARVAWVRAASEADLAALRGLRSHLFERGTLTLREVVQAWREEGIEVDEACPVLFVRRAGHEEPEAWPPR